MRIVFLPTLVASLVVCGTARAQTTMFVAPTSETVSARLDGSLGTLTGASITVTNRSTVPITVTAVTLKDCVNIRQFCGAQNMDVQIEGGSQRVVMHVQSRNTGTTASVRYSYAWRADSTGIKALGAMAQSGSNEAAARLASIKRADSLRKLDVGFKDIELYDKDVLELGDKVYAFHAEPDSIEVKQGSVLFLQQLRILVVAADGKSLGRYRGRFRFRVIPSPAVRLARPDSLIATAPGRATVEVTVTPTVTPEVPPVIDPAKLVRFTLIVP